MINFLEWIACIDWDSEWLVTSSISFSFINTGKTHPTWPKTWKKIPRNGRARMRKVRSWVSNVCSSSGSPLSSDSVLSTLGWPLRRYIVRMRKWLFPTDNICTEAFQLQRKAWKYAELHAFSTRRSSTGAGWCDINTQCKLPQLQKDLEKKWPAAFFAMQNFWHQVTKSSLSSFFWVFWATKTLNGSVQIWAQCHLKDIRLYKSKLGSPLQKTPIFGRLWAYRTSVKKGHVIDTWRRYG